ncbi:CRISPR-associated protein Cas4 [Methanobacterium spitsbergense]|uniref:CRISPR-associated exonuclease Cas4 n=1 Tax=Methanobacterium spitsbergense TaxID=2874285 RepID=A0A8T5URZ2_9EURY|nr:CRISPR-associated protein Cas4 [Methanobacterium spitsbergense]MBZ2164736.1 CRISPR-associated protein Cas4 [Methanobacterium spitsbergense]
MKKKFNTAPHPTISQVKIIEERNNFPISWLNKQGFCEYGIYLENVKGIEIKPTKSMVEGTKVHATLEANFREDAEPTTFDEMLETSKTGEILSRELPVMSKQHGIRGFIDEVWMTPDEFVIIDDKPGTRAYSSSINQVFGYCLAFKEMIPEKRRIVASLKQRGTENIYWASYFDEKAEKDIINLINRMHRLLEGEIEFKATDNPNKCRSCRFNTICERKMDF